MIFELFDAIREARYCVVLGVDGVLKGGDGVDELVYPVEFCRVRLRADNHFPITAHEPFR